MKILTCVCCGSEVTCPQMHNGLVYGYTCIKKVDPTRQAVKVKFVPVELVSIRPGVKLGKNLVKDAIKFRFDGKLYLNNFVDATQRLEVDGQMFVSEQVIKACK